MINLIPTRLNNLVQQNLLFQNSSFSFRGYVYSLHLGIMFTFKQTLFKITNLLNSKSQSCVFQLFIFLMISCIKLKTINVSQTFSILH